LGRASLDGVDTNGPDGHLCVLGLPERTWDTIGVHKSVNQCHVLTLCPTQHSVSRPQIFVSGGVPIENPTSVFRDGLSVRSIGLCANRLEHARD